MIRKVLDTFTKKDKYRRVTFEYNTETDEELLNEIESLIATKQKLCTNCKNFRIGGNFCGYEDHSCCIHGNLDAHDNPHHDSDGSKCPDYENIKQEEHDCT